MTKQEAHAFRERWKRVNAFTAAEQRNLTVEQRWQSVEAAWRLARSLGLPLHSSDDESQVWERWRRLREIHRQESSE